MSLFTFHNVSINTDLHNFPGDCKTHLHSTMFLLIRETEFSWWTMTSRFTFHNVSINTVAAISGSSAEDNLHSTMFLLILFHVIFPPFVTLHLHSTMFLLILVPMRLPTRPTENLHSTMFLLIRVRQSYRQYQSGVFTFHNVSINTNSYTPM